MHIHTSPKHIPESFEDRKATLQHILDVNVLFRALAILWKYCGGDPSLSGYRICVPASVSPPTRGKTKSRVSICPVPKKYISKHCYFLFGCKECNRNIGNTTVTLLHFLFYKGVAVVVLLALLLWLAWPCLPSVPAPWSAEAHLLRGWRDMSILMFLHGLLVETPAHPQFFVHAAAFEFQKCGDGAKRSATCMCVQSMLYGFSLCR